MVITAIILIAAVIAFLSRRLPAPLIALLVALALYLTGTTTLEQTLAGFADPIVLYLAGLFVVSEALDSTGVTAWAGQQLTRRLGEGRSVVLIALMLLCALLTALISVNGAVAALVPVAVTLAARTGTPPSQMLLPLAFAAHAGSMLTLLGTPINLLVSDLAVDAGSRPLEFFEFALVGVPMLVGVIVITLLLGPRLLPHRYPDNAAPDLSRYAETLAAEHSFTDGQGEVTYEDGVVEIVIPPRSEFLGETVHPGMLTESGDLVIASVHRSGKPIEHAELGVGDVLVLHGAWEALEKKVSGPGVLGVADPDQIRRQSVRLGPRAVISTAVLMLMCLALAMQLLPAAIVVLLAAAVLVALRVVPLDRALRSVSLSTVLIVAGMIPMSTAIQASGIADLLSSTLVDTLGAGSPRLLLVCIVALVLVMGQFLSNLATVLIVAPVAVAIAEGAGVSPLPMMMGITVAGAASFLTPVATPGNLMVQDAGTYTFGDYWKLGLPCLLLFGVIATVLVPVIWPF